jgi:MoaA/NifB/PqqE/SkfB family radical SAM enzyme
MAKKTKEKNKIDPGKMKQREEASNKKKHWVRLTGICNNACLFCLDRDSQDGLIKPFDQVKKDLLLGQEEGISQVVLSGGEATIHPEFLKIVKFAKKIGYSHVQVITNGRMFFYGDFLYSAVRAGVNEITFSLHGHNAKLHDYQTQINGSFDQAVSALKKALEIPGLIISVDIVISKINCKYLYDILQFFIGLGVREFDLLQVIPFGRAWENKEVLFYDIKKCFPFIKKALELSRRADLFIWTNRFPAQYLEGFEELIQNPLKLKDEVRGRGVQLRNYIENGVSMPCFGEPCSFCFLKSFCEDLIELREKGILNGRQLPVCVNAPLEKNEKRIFEFDKNLNLNNFLDFFIGSRYFVKSLRCEECSFNSDCDGIHIENVRKNGFGLLKPFLKHKVPIRQDDAYYSKNELQVDHLNFVLKNRGGFKKIIRYMQHEEDLKKVFEDARKKNLYYETADFFIKKSDADGLIRKAKDEADGGNAQKIVYISSFKKRIRDIKNLEKKLFAGEALGIEETADITKKIGKLFEYPECCIDFFSKYLLLTTSELNFILLEKSKSFFWQLNSLDPKLGLLPHVPCGFDCKKSLDFARKAFGTLKKCEGANAAAKIKDYLQSPFLYFKSGRFIRLEGFLKDGSFYYENIFYFEPAFIIEKYKDETKLFQKIINILSRGSRIAEKRGLLFVFDKKNNELCELEKFKDYFIYALFK